MDPSKTYQMTVPAPMVWCHVVDPRPERKDATGRVFKACYEATFLFTPEHPDWTPLRTLMRSAVDPGVTNPTFPVDDGNTIANAAQAKNKDREWARGKILFKAKSNVVKLDGSPLIPPRLVVLLGNKYVNYDTTDAPRALASKFFYSGVLAVGTFHVQGYTGMGGGVTAYLNEIMSLNTGERIAGGPDAEEKYGDAGRFTQYMGSASSINPSEGLTGLV